MFERLRMITLLPIIACSLLWVVLVAGCLIQSTVPLLQASPTPAIVFPASAATSTYPNPPSPVTSTAAIAEQTGNLVLAPDFNLPREDGSLIRLSDYRGKSTIVLVFYRGRT
jgi:hypothetical protein